MILTSPRNSRTFGLYTLTVSMLPKDQKLMAFRGTLLPSVRWGQVQSVYIRGGVQPDDSKDGRSVRAAMDSRNLLT